MDTDSTAQVLALVRHHISERQGIQILVSPYTQVRTVRRKLYGQHYITCLSITHVNGHFRWLPGRKQDLRDMRTLALTCKQYPCF